MTEEEAWSHRHDDRVYWYNFANEYRKYDPGKLVKLSLAQSDMVLGLRDDKEIIAMKEENLVDITIWVHRQGIPKDPTMTFNETSADIIIDNSGEVQQLYTKLDNLISFANLPKRL